MFLQQSYDTDAGVSLELKNCSFSKKKVDNMSHVISHQRLNILEEARHFPCCLEQPPIVTGLEFISKLCDLFFGFVQHFNYIASLLHNKLMEVQLFHFGALDNKKFQHSRRSKQAPIAASFDSTNPLERYMFSTNAGNKQVRCVILQEKSCQPAKNDCSLVSLIDQA